MSIITENTRKKHAGPRNVHAICLRHQKENGPRPIIAGLKGEEKKHALSARARWDSALMARSTVIATSVNNDVCKISDDGFVVRR